MFVLKRFRGEVTDSEVLDGILLNKDVVHPKMKREITNPRIILLDCSLEYKRVNLKPTLKSQGRRLEQNITNRRRTS